jgi:hypothetical protein
MGVKHQDAGLVALSREFSPVKEAFGSFAMLGLSYNHFGQDK